MKYILVSNTLTDADIYFSGNDNLILRTITSDNASNFSANQLIHEELTDTYSDEIKTAIITTKTQHMRTEMFGVTGCKKCTESGMERPILVVFDESSQKLLRLCQVCHVSQFKKVSHTVPMHFLEQMLSPSI